MRFSSEKYHFYSFIKKRLLILVTLISILLSFASVSAFALEEGTAFEANLKGEKYGVIGNNFVVYLTFENFSVDEFLGASAIIDYDADVFEIDSVYFDIIRGYDNSNSVNSETYPLIDAEEGWVFWGNNEIIGSNGYFYVNVLNDLSDVTSLSGKNVSCFVEFKVKENASVSKSIIKIDTDSELVGVFSETLVESKYGTGSQISVSIVKFLPSNESYFVLNDNSTLFMGYNEFSSLNVVYGFREKSTVYQIKSEFKNFSENISIYNENVALNDSDIVSTGSIIQLSIDNEVVDFKTLICKGDVDGSGEVDSTDYLLIKKYFIGDLALDSAFLVASDIDCNSIIDSTDYIRIKSYFLGNIDIYAQALFYKK